MLEPLTYPGDISRRSFLQITSTGLLALAIPARWTRGQAELDPGQLGRILEPTADIFLEPTFASLKVKTCWRDEVLELDGAAVGGPQPEYNRVWYGVKDLGYVHSSAVQPVRQDPAPPVHYIPYGGLLMEVCVPFVDVYWNPKRDTERAYRFYYETTHWITSATLDSKKRLWYRIEDDKYDYAYFARAENLRPIELAEQTPISPDVPADEKRIEVNLSEQWVQCFEGSNPVFIAKVSTGRQYDDGSYWTPEGKFMTFRKRPSRHMTAGNLASGYDLPGVPWVSYITEDGVSFHGTYWHNDFGTPRSHGCINMTPQAAKWLFRWTQPIVPSQEKQVWLESGTNVEIHS
jgi:lipoprotein-anchoring transpeptidase ErfK/SrfK